jgi:hypothetical protein
MIKAHLAAEVTEISRKSQRGKLESHIRMVACEIVQRSRKSARFFDRFPKLERRASYKSTTEDTEVHREENTEENDFTNHPVAGTVCSS